MKLIILFSIMFSSTIIAQDNRIAQFAVWKPIAGQETAFQRGYQRHLQWHKANGDTWEWYGWYVSSGPRVGQFVDATFDHAWSDFDNAVDPAGDRADNQINVIPYGDIQSVFKVYYLKDQSISSPIGLKSKFLRLLTLDVTDVPGGIRLLDRLKASFRSNPDITTLLAYKVVDGGNTNQLVVILGFENWEQYGKSENVPEQLSAIERALKTKTLMSATSETLTYRADMSLFPD